MNAPIFTVFSTVLHHITTNGKHVLIVSIADNIIKENSIYNVKLIINNESEQFITDTRFTFYGIKEHGVVEFRFTGKNFNNVLLFSR